MGLIKDLIGIIVFVLVIFLLFWGSFLVYKEYKLVKDVVGNTEANNGSCDIENGILTCEYTIMNYSFRNHSTDKVVVTIKG